MKIVIVGGHFSPALSIVENLMDKNEIFYFGRKTNFEGDKGLSLEYSQIQALGIKFYPITAARYQRKFTRYTLISFSKLPVGFIQSYRLLSKLKPSVVLAFGGYLSIPVCLSAKILNIPVVIHEQTLEAGFANKFISNFADKVLVSWESSRKFFPESKTILTGLPLTKEIVSVKKQKKEKEDIKTIYITGGSSGAHFINQIVLDSLEGLLNNFYVIHQTGDSVKFNDYDKANLIKQSLSKKLSDRYFVKKFFTAKESSNSIQKADIVLGRAGINTISELIYLEKPALLIPLPFGQKNEQQNNANFLKDLGLAEIVSQKDLTSDDLVKKIKFMISSLGNYRLKKDVLVKNAEEKIINILQDVSKKTTA